MASMATPVPTPSPPILVPEESRASDLPNKDFLYKDFPDKELPSKELPNKELPNIEADLPNKEADLPKKESRLDPQPPTAVIASSLDENSEFRPETPVTPDTLPPSTPKYPVSTPDDPKIQFEQPSASSSVVSSLQTPETIPDSSELSVSESADLPAASLEVTHGFDVTETSEPQTSEPTTSEPTISESTTSEPTVAFDIQDKLIVVDFVAQAETMLSTVLHDPASPVDHAHASSEIARGIACSLLSLSDDNSDPARTLRLVVLGLCYGVIPSEQAMIIAKETDDQKTKSLMGLSDEDVYVEASDKSVAGWLENHDVVRGLGPVAPDAILRVAFASFWPNVALLVIRATVNLDPQKPDTHIEYPPKPSAHFAAIVGNMVTEMNWTGLNSLAVPYWVVAAFLGVENPFSPWESPDINAKRCVLAYAAVVLCGPTELSDHIRADTAPSASDLPRPNISGILSNLSCATLAFHLAAAVQSPSSLALVAVLLLPLCRPENRQAVSSLLMPGMDRECLRSYIGNLARTSSSSVSLILSTAVAVFSDSDVGGRGDG